MTKRTKPGTWCYSNNEERFEGECSSREEALLEAQAKYCDEFGDCDPLWTGRSAPYTFFSTTWADDIIQRLSDNANEELGDVADEWPPLPSNEAAAELDHAITKVVTRWVKKHCPPTFWKVVDIEKHLPAGDIE